MKLIILIALCLTSCNTVSQKPLCRHIVLSQYAAFVDAGYEAEIWHLHNLKPGKYKYHIAVRTKIDGQWQWVRQQNMTYTTTTEQPPNTRLRKKMTIQEVVNWIKTKQNKGE